MRSISLSGIISVNGIKNQVDWHMTEDNTTKMHLYSKDQIIDTYNINEQSIDNMWVYEISVQFEDRLLNIACRTVYEFENWIKVFSLLLKMKNVGVSLTTINPFVFEKQHFKGGVLLNEIVKQYKSEMKRQH